MAGWKLGLTVAFGLAFAGAGSVAVADGACFDFAAVDALALGALEGENVDARVPGFELILLLDGRPVFHSAYGAWTIGQVTACDSATKTISGALIAILAEDDGVPFALDTRLAELIPAFGGDKAEITIRQCFSHTAGFGRSDTLGDPTISLYEAALDIADDALLYEPGTTFAYGGTSMQAAGAAAEVAAGTAWGWLFEDRLARPLGLTFTRFAIASPSNPRIAGGVESTAEEFARFMEMLRRGGRSGSAQVMPSTAVHALLTRQTPVGVPIGGSPVDSADYGIGVWLDQRNAAGELVGALAAGARGFSAWVDLDDRMVGVFATDLTRSQNIRKLVDLIRAAAEVAVRSPQPCDGRGGVRRANGRRVAGP